MLVRRGCETLNHLDYAIDRYCDLDGSAEQCATRRSTVCSGCRQDMVVRRPHAESGLRKKLYMCGGEPGASLAVVQAVESAFSECECRPSSAAGAQLPPKLHRLGKQQVHLAILNITAAQVSCLSKVDDGKVYFPNG